MLLAGRRAGIEDDPKTAPQRFTAIGEAASGAANRTLIHLLAASTQARRAAILLVNTRFTRGGIEMTTNTDTIALPTSGSARRASGSSAGRFAGFVVAGFALFAGILIMAGGAGVVGIQAFAGDDGGFVSIEEERLTSGGHAVATDVIDLSGEIAGFGVDDLEATVRLDAEATAGEPVFVGIARRADVERYLQGVGHTTLLGLREDQPRYRQHEGTRPASRPGTRPFWVASSQGTGTQSIEWAPRDGHWMAVVANADAGRGMDADVEASARVPWLTWAGFGVMLFGATITGLGAFAISRLRRDR